MQILYDEKNNRGHTSIEENQSKREAVLHPHAAIIAALRIAAGPLRVDFQLLPLLNTVLSDLE